MLLLPCADLPVARQDSEKSSRAAWMSRFFFGGVTGVHSSHRWTPDSKKTVLGSDLRMIQVGCKLLCYLLAPQLVLKIFV